MERPTKAVRAYRTKFGPVLANRYLYLQSRWVPVGPSAPPYPACYVIQDAGITVYVGQTINLRTRLISHRAGIIKELKNPKVLARYGVKFGDWAMREARLIRKLKPLYNVQGCGHD